ncbi:hypothetical protein HNP77_001943 [Treponema rectale]|uniref:Fibronectin type-III domain-containing protein n=1 Tax=Treponema rectale TaxID=744512 RepID=A0A840SJK8_9SPIR|nr:fibronectin type III domain-containing protein [Treponema rectale]MBB5219561.1 hypothetical protein [Treponema rectale]
MKEKIIKAAVLMFILPAFLMSCVDVEKAEESGSLVISQSEISIDNALATSSSAEITAYLENADGVVNFKSLNESVVTVEKTSPNKAVLTAQGDGTAKICVYTDDGKYVKYCTVNVTLGKIFCHDVTDIKEGEVTEESASLFWTAPSDASLVEVSVMDESLEILNVVYFPAKDGSGTVENLEPKTVYNFKVRGANNPGTSKEVFSKNYSDVIQMETDEFVLAPGNVEDVIARVTDHTITLTWTDPSDKYYSAAVITVTSDAKKFDGSAFTSEETEIEVPIGKKYVSWSDVQADTEYTFNIRSKDKFGNVQGDANNASAEGVNYTARTEEDVDAPSAVSDVFIDVSSDGVSCSWTCPDTFDAKNIVVAENDTELARVPASSVSAVLSELTEGIHSLKIWVEDYDENKSAVLAAEVATGASASAPSDVTAEAHFSDAIIVKWTDISDAETSWNYSIRCVNTSDETEYYNINPDSTVCCIQNLTAGSTYKASVYCSAVKDGYTVRYVTDVAGNSASAKAVRILRDIRFNWDSRALVPFISADESTVFDNVVCVQHDSAKEFDLANMKYPVWIVRPSLSNPASEEYFSLEAATSSGEESGLYLDFEASSSGFSTDFDVDNTTWGSASNPHGYAVESSAVTDVTTASFKIGDKVLDSSITGFSDWGHILTESGKEVYASNSNPYLVDSIPKENEYWCYKDTVIGE